MSQRNSKIILCKNINIDREYKNVTDYTTNQMLALCRSSDHLIRELDDFSFVRVENRNRINTDFSYSECIQANYIAIQNPDFSNKWFFGFIDKVEYNSDVATIINFTIDAWTTWFDDWNPRTCLVLREHVNDDTIGLHTFPEGLEHGDYIANFYDELGGFDVEQCKVIVGVTWLPSNTPNLPDRETGQFYGGNFSGVYYMAMTYSNAKKFINALDGLGRGDAVVTVFMAPASLCTGKEYTATINSKLNDGMGKTTDVKYTITWILIPNNYGGVMILSDYNISMNSKLNGYTPKNNKLFCFPYNYLLFTNQVGGNAEYHYEDFINNQPVFNIIGTISPGCSIKLYPENYKKIPDSVSNHPGFMDGLIGAKFPICSWQNDLYTNWMTQQSVNNMMSMIQTGLSVGSFLATKGEVGGIGGLFSQQANYLSERYQRALVSPQASGSTNGGDVTFARNEQNFGYYKMSIKREYAQMIDDHFSKYGYQVNVLKVPNLVGRSNWNFIQIASDDEIGNGSVPTSYMEEINNACRRGLTIWHNHANIGNYSLSNNIV